MKLLKDLQYLKVSSLDHLRQFPAHKDNRTLVSLRGDVWPPNLSAEWNSSRKQISTAFGKAQFDKSYGWYGIILWQLDWKIQAIGSKVLAYNYFQCCLLFS